MQCVVATHNSHKLAEIRRILQPLGIEVLIDESLPDVEETGTTFAENACLKAAAACRYTGLPAIADDSGLMVDALDGAPGVYSARYAGENATDHDRILKLLSALADVPQDARGAQFVSAICCIFPDGDMVTANGICRGHIAFAEQGDNGFGYDPVFLPVEYDGKSYAEISPEQKDAISHRGRALRVFADELTAFLKKHPEHN